MVSLTPGGKGLELVVYQTMLCSDPELTQLVKKLPVSQSNTYQLLLGTVMVKEVMAYWLVAGLVMVRYSSHEPLGVTGFHPKGCPTCRTSGFEFVACTGAAMGTSTSIPDSASNASIVPELNLLRYIEDVFKYIFVGRGRRIGI